MLRQFSQLAPLAPHCLSLSPSLHSPWPLQHWVSLQPSWHSPPQPSGWPAHTLVHFGVQHSQPPASHRPTVPFWELLHCFWQSVSSQHSPASSVTPSQSSSLPFPHTSVVGRTWPTQAPQLPDVQVLTPLLQAPTSWVKPSPS